MYTPLALRVCDMARVPEWPLPMTVISIRYPSPSIVRYAPP